MYCPACSSQNITIVGTSPNGGDLLAMEAFEEGNEVYSEKLITACNCNSCKCSFYVEI